MATASYAQDAAATPVGRLSAWEVAKAYAFSVILADVSDNLDTPAAGSHTAQWVAHSEVKRIFRGRKAATPCCMSTNSWP